PVTILVDKSITVTRYIQPCTVRRQVISPHKCVVGTGGVKLRRTKSPRYGAFSSAMVVRLYARRYLVTNPSFRMVLRTAYNDAAIPRVASSAAMVRTPAKPRFASKMVVICSAIRSRNPRGVEGSDPRIVDTGF